MRYEICNYFTVVETVTRKQVMSCDYRSDAEGYCRRLNEGADLDTLKQEQYRELDMEHRDRMDDSR